MPVRAAFTNLELPHKAYMGDKVCKVSKGSGFLTGLSARQSLGYIGRPSLLLKITHIHPQNYVRRRPYGSSRVQVSFWGRIMFSVSSGILTLRHARVYTRVFKSEGF